MRWVFASSIVQRSGSGGRFIDPAFRTVDLVDAVALPNQFAFWARRQVEVSDEYVTWVVFLISVAFAGATATASADRKAPN
jgi:hypothetical protein